LKESQKQGLFRVIDELGNTCSEFEWEKTMADIKEHAVRELQEKLRMAHEELKLKDEEVAKLSRIRQDVEAELQELTASLFEVSY